MKSLIALIIALLYVVFISAAFAAKTHKNTKDVVYFQGESKQFQIKWSANDILVTRQNKKIYSALDDMRTSAKYILDESYSCDIDQDVRLMSLVGPYMSLRYHYYDDPIGPDGSPQSAHPGGETAYLTIDLRHPGHPILDILKEKSIIRPELTDLFPVKDVLAALQHDSIINHTFASVDLQNLPAFRQVLAAYVSINPLSKYCGTFEPRFLNAFYFHHKDHDKLAVRLGVSGSGPCRENLTELGILLPVPQSLDHSAKLASAQKEGFLAIDMDKRLPHACTKYGILLKNHQQ